MYLSEMMVTPKLKGENYTEKWATCVPVLTWQWWGWRRCEVQNDKAKFDFILASGGLKRSWRWLSLGDGGLGSGAGQAGLCAHRPLPRCMWAACLPLTLRCGVSSCAGFANPAISDPQSTYLEEGPGTSIDWPDMRKCGRRGWTHFSVHDQDLGPSGWHQAASCRLTWPLPRWSDV